MQRLGNAITYAQYTGSIRPYVRNITLKPNVGTGPGPAKPCEIRPRHFCDDTVILTPRSPVAEAQNFITILLPPQR